jgi:hypothetical protein
MHIEGPDEAAVRTVAESLGQDLTRASYGSVDRSISPYLNAISYPKTDSPSPD